MSFEERIRNAETDKVHSFNTVEELLEFICQPETDAQKATVAPHTLEPVKKLNEDIGDAIQSYMEAVEKDDSDMETVLGEICATLSKYLCGTARFGSLPITALLVGITSDYRKQQAE